MKTANDLLPKFLKGDDEAIRFNSALYEIAELWDDLIDNDETTRAGINAAFYAALITLPRNGFYQRHFALLNPIMEAAILDWFTANELESTGSIENKRAAFILRCGLQAVTVMSARIIGGVEWAQAVNLELRQQGDTWAEYSAKLGAK